MFRQTNNANEPPVRPIKFLNKVVDSLFEVERIGFNKVVAQLEQSIRSMTDPQLQRWARESRLVEKLRNGGMESIPMPMTAREAWVIREAFGEQGEFYVNAFCLRYVLVALPFG